MRRRRSAWLAWGIIATSLVLTVVGWLLHSKNAAVPRPAMDEPLSRDISALIPIGMVIVFCLPAALIVARQPGNPIGWLLGVMGYSIGVSYFASEYGFYTVVTQPGSLPAGILMLWLADALDPLLIGAIPLLVLLFPTGRVPSRGWWPVAWVTVAATGLLAMENALYPRDLGGDPRLPTNPTGMPGAEGTLDSLGEFALMLLLVVALASLLSVAVRFEGAKGAERQQLKWFAMGAVSLVVTSVALVPLSWSGVYWPILIGFGLFTACITVAMLRYHLYDIDRLINRTIVYGLLTAILGLCYVAGSLVFVLVAGAATDPPGWLVAAATLAAAAVVRPAQRRVQAMVDRRFDRRKYDAAKTIEAFSARLRDEIDLDTLSAELLAVVDQTMQPTKVSLWLRPRT